MLENSQLLFQILGSLVFLGSMVFFFGRLRSSYLQSKNKRRNSDVQYLPYDLFLGMTSLCILLVIWVDSLKSSFVEMLLLCGLGAWAVQRALRRQPKTKS